MAFADELPKKLIDNYKLLNLRVMGNVTENEYKEALKKVQKYYRQVTGKKESINFYVFYIQPIIKCIESCEGEKQPDKKANAINTLLCAFKNLDTRTKIDRIFQLLMSIGLLIMIIQFLIAT